MLATLKSTPSVNGRFADLVNYTDEEKQKINKLTTEELDDMEPLLTGLNKKADELINDINAAAVAEAAAEAARSKVKGQVKDIQKKITKIVPTLTNLTDKKDFQSRLDDLSAVIEKDKPLIEKSSLTELSEYEKFFTGIDAQVNDLIMNIVSAEDEEKNEAKKSKTFGILDLSGDVKSPPTSPKLKPKPKPKPKPKLDDSDDDDNVPLPPTSTTSKWADMFGSPDTTTELGFGEKGGGKKQRKRFTKKKQNNNKNNIKKKQNNNRDNIKKNNNKKKRTSIKKNKKRIVTRNTRRRIFE